MAALIFEVLGRIYSGKYKKKEIFTFGEHIVAF